MRGTIVTLFFLLITSSVFAQTYTVEEVLSGDTLKLTNGETVKLIGMNAPEADTKMGQDATKQAKWLVEGFKVLLEYDVDKTDKYGKLLAYVYIEDKRVKLAEAPFYKEIDGKTYTFLNGAMIWLGYASPNAEALGEARPAQGRDGQPMIIPPNVKYADLFQELYKEARNEGRGLWKEPSEKYADESYCEEDPDCIIVDGCCGSRIPLNIYYDEDKLLAPCATRLCGGGPIYENPRCENNKCIADESRKVAEGPSKDMKDRIEVSTEDKSCENDSECAIISDLSCTSEHCHCKAVAYNTKHFEKYKTQLEECRKDRIIARCDNRCRKDFPVKCVEGECQIK